MEIGIMGAGEVVIRYIDRQGQTLLQERLVISGPPGVRALRYVPLSIGTEDGPAELVPVVVSVGNSRQRVRFDGEDPTRFVRRRGNAIGCSASVTRDASRGKAPAPTPRAPGFGTAGEPAMRDVLRAASGRARRRG